MSNQKKTNEEVSSEFKSFYLQQATQEYAEDLDKVRTADDFKNDALSLLIKALEQGTETFTTEEKRRVVDSDNAKSKD